MYFTRVNVPGRPRASSHKSSLINGGSDKSSIDRVNADLARATNRPGYFFNHTRTTGRGRRGETTQQSGLRGLGRSMGEEGKEGGGSKIIRQESNCRVARDKNKSNIECRISVRGIAEAKARTGEKHVYLMMKHCLPSASPFLPLCGDIMDG